MTDKPHGNTGKKNALKGDDVADAYLHIRCTKAQKGEYIKASRSKGLKLTQWALEHLDKIINNNH